MNRIGVIGAGSFGTALAIQLAQKGHNVKMTSVSADHLLQMQNERENKKYLPGIKFPEGLSIVMTTEEAVKDAEVVLFSAPAQKFRSAFEKAIPFLDDETVVVNVAKGIEQGTLMRLSQIASLLKPGVKYACLSGPSHAEEVGAKLPTTVAVSSEDMSVAEFVQDVFITDRFRVYTNEDLCGTELGGALKNIIALGAGISDGIGFGDNAKAALMTRGLTEICRLGIKMGAEMSTFSGLTGIGDLIVTCTSMHSRNRRCGIMIGEGMKPEDAIKKVGMVVEGIYTAQAAQELAKQLQVEMPITECICRCINNEITAKEAVELLMGRNRKNEMNIL